MKYSVAVLQRFRDSRGTHFQIHNLQTTGKSKTYAITQAMKFAQAESSAFERYYDDVDYSSTVLGVVAVEGIPEDSEIGQGDYTERMDKLYKLSKKESEYVKYIKLKKVNM